MLEGKRKPSHAIARVDNDNPTGRPSGIPKTIMNKLTLEHVLAPRFALLTAVTALLAAGSAMAQTKKTLPDDTTVAAGEYGTEVKLDKNTGSDTLITDISLENGSPDSTAVAWKINAAGQIIENSLQVINTDNGAQFSVAPGETVVMADADDAGTGQDSNAVKVTCSTHH